MPKRKKSGPSAAGPADAAVLKKKTVKQLRAMLKKAGLETTGRKSMLVERLLAGLPNTKRQSQLDVPKDLLPHQYQSSGGGDVPIPRAGVVMQAAREDPKKGDDDAQPPTKKKKGASQKVSPTVHSSTALSSPTLQGQLTLLPGTAIRVDRPLSTSELTSDRVFVCAQKCWRGADQTIFLDNTMIDKIFATEMGRGDYSYSRMMALDSSGYLDKYLWPLYDCQSGTDVHALSIMLLFNFRIAAGVPIFPPMFRDDASERESGRAKLNKDTATNLGLDNDVLIEILRSFINGYSWNREVSDMSALAQGQAVGSKLPQQIFVDVIVSIADMDAQGQANWDLHSHKGDTVLLLEMSPSHETTVTTTLKQMAEIESSMDKSIEAEYDALVGRVQQARLATVVDILDDQGTSVLQRKRNTHIVGNRRTLRLSLSPVQYIHDMQKGKEFITSTMSSLNSILYGSFKLSVSYSLVQGLSKLLRSHMNSSGNNGFFKFPSWLGSALLGLRWSKNSPNNESTNTGGVSSVAADSLGTFDALDLFENQAHLEEVFGSKLKLSRVEDEDDGEDLDDSQPSGNHHIPYAFKIYSPNQHVVEALPYRQKKNQGNRRKLRGVRLVSAQSHAIIGAMRKGMITLVEGGPGTGKSAVATCLAGILAHGGLECSHGRVLVIGNSERVVDRMLFRLVRELNVDQRHVVRLGRQGYGPGNFGAAGRRDHCLERMRVLLKEVSRLSVSLGVTSLDTPSMFTCETANHFYKVHVGPRIKAFHESVNRHGGAHDPFVAYFQGSAAKDKNDAERRFEHLRSIFLELRDYRALELLQNRRKQLDYVVCKLARVVVTSADYITTAHEDLGEIGFFASFDSVIVDGAEHIADANLLLTLSLLCSVGEIMVSSAAQKEESTFTGTGDARGSTSGYQNLAEAEYVVAVYQYMRLIGYPAQNISILTVHAAQCALIKDVLNLRCVPSPAFFGKPRCLGLIPGESYSARPERLANVERRGKAFYVKDLLHMVSLVGKMLHG
eukprot:g3916.t1